MNITVKATLNTGSVREKLKAWEKSSAGANAMRKKIDEYVNRDVRTTQAGSRVLTKKWVAEMANELADAIRANAAGLPGSVAADVNSISAGNVTYVGGGAMMAELNFSGDLMRSSLVPERYGDVNIVALFEKGYHASSQVVGYWHGEPTFSLTDRPGAWFITNAVEWFNGKYAGLGVTATVLGVYA